jgi:spore cortex biosynthesis protein YabQ
METTTMQPVIFMITIYGGMLVGAVYDFYRGIRTAFKKGKWVTAILDIFFIITLGIIVVYVMYTANQGELRLYTFIGFIIGFMLYIAGVSPFIMFLTRKIHEKIKKIRSIKKDK